MENNSKTKDYKKRKAQSFMEYTVLFCCIVAALIAMQIYIKRSIQGRLRNAADEIGEQYSAKTTNSDTTVVISSFTNTNGRSNFLNLGSLGKYEIMVTNRTENTTTDIVGGYEQTGKLSDESLF